ncbi:DUF1761 domain-containing protein [Kangiella aquimarina]|uniref:DUF1761 domain-containing protein n=1 Tax=Kangiella aquimarina TaxID=261965 RepID=A0ABZ0X3R4_9GAMM|nr:DUF1761 domain-containing protein [Kangiella aquimarina]WQG85237.1 DUF1761 domain-containing protein [Kangiella aquimarina]
MSDINYYAVLVAAILSFAVGGLWYSPMLFGRIWLKEMKIEAEDIKQKPSVFILSFIFALVAVFVIADLLGPNPDLIHAVTVCAMVGAIVFLGLGITYQFSNKSLRHLLIDGGYHLVIFTLFGLILGSWH